MFICIVNSEQEYLDLIADLSRYGLHKPNPYAHDPDQEGMSVVDSFLTLPSEISEEYLGVRDYKWETTVEVDENGDEWEVEPGPGTGPLDRSALHFCPELQENLVTPETKDYPILIMWDWGDDFDRFGAVKTRYFDWISMAEIPFSHKDGSTTVKQRAELWRERYAGKFKELCRLDEERRKQRFKERK